MQYPLPYFITAFFRSMDFFPPSSSREARELGVLCFLAIAAAGFAARYWFCKRFTPLAGTLAAIVYMSLPYTLAQGIYARAAIGEFCTFVWMPLLFSVLDSNMSRATEVVCLSLVIALFSISNILILVLFVPALIFYGMAIGDFTPKSVATRIILLLSALLIGIGISAVYLLPFAVYGNYFDVSGFTSNLPNWDLGKYFLFITSRSIFKTRIVVLVLIPAIMFALLVARYLFNNKYYSNIFMAVMIGLTISMAIPDVGPALIKKSGLHVSSFDTPNEFTPRMFIITLYTISLGFLSYCRVSQMESDRRNSVLLVIASGALFFMLPWSAPLWKAVPALAPIQFPMRLGAILTVAVAGLIAAAIDDCLRNWADKMRRPSPYLLGCSIALVIGGGLATWSVYRNFLNPDTVHLDLTRSVDVAFRTYVPPRHLFAFANIIGAKPDSFEVVATSYEDKVISEFVKGQGIVNVKLINSREFIVSVDSPQGGRIRLGQLYFPLWKIMPTNKISQTSSIDSSPEGLIELTVPPGKQDLNLVLVRGWPERYGVVASIVSLLFVGMLYWTARSRRKQNYMVSNGKHLS